MPEHPRDPARSPDQPLEGGQHSTPQPTNPQKIRHVEPLGVPLSEDSVAPTPVKKPGPTTAPGPGGASKIRTFAQSLGSAHEENWNRTPNTTGTGAIHVKSFHCKLTGDSLTYLDQQINEWLDAHPQYEVKIVTTSIGIWTGKLKEPNLIVNVWV